MTVPIEAIEAAATTLRKFHPEVLDDDARAALEAAMPAIREAIAQEILSLQPRDMIRWMNEVGASDMSVKAATAYVRHIAARIARGGTP